MIAKLSPRAGSVYPSPYLLQHFNVVLVRPTHERKAKQSESATFRERKEKGDHAYYISTTVQDVWRSAHRASKAASGVSIPRSQTEEVRLIEGYIASEVALRRAQLEF